MTEEENQRVKCLERKFYHIPIGENGKEKEVIGKRLKKTYLLGLYGLHPEQALQCSFQQGVCLSATLTEALAHSSCQLNDIQMQYDHQRSGHGCVMRRVQNILR